MKLLLLLTLVGLAASRYVPLKTGMPQQFLYEYDSQIATGIEEVSNQFSTMRMRFKVLLQTDGVLDSETGAQRWNIIFKEVNVRQRSNTTEQLPKILLPMDQFRNLETPELWRKIETALKQPFVCWIKTQLSIVKISFQRNDPFWSINLKKGFLQMLQLNFLPKDESIDIRGKEQWTKEEDEMTVADVCKTFYSVEKVRFHEASSKLYKVEKVIDFKNCKNPIDNTRNLPGMWNGLQHSEKIPLELNKQILTVNNAGKFFVFSNPDGTNFLVKQASVRTIYTLAPYTESMHGSEKVITIQKLKLLSRVEEGEISTSDLVPRNEGLRLIFPQEATISDTDALIRDVIEKLKQLRPNKYEEKLDMKVYESIVRTIRFHVKDSSQLLNIVNKLKETVDDSTEQKRLVRLFVLDICPQVNTNACVEFLMNVVRSIVRDDSFVSYLDDDTELGIGHIPIIFAKLSMMGKVQLKTLQTVFDVVRSDRFKSMLVTDKTMSIYSSAWLSLGGLVNVYFSRQGGVEPYLLPFDELHLSEDFGRKYKTTPWNMRRDYAVKIEKFRREFITEVREALKTSSTHRALAIKVIKNCGLFEFYKDLKTIINSRDSVSITDRVQAVYATQNMLLRQTLSRLTSTEVTTLVDELKFIKNNEEYMTHFDQMSRKIQSFLLKCFRNVREDPELRIACYRVLIQSPVKQFTLNVLVQSILSDPSQVVYTYCVQHMSQIVKSTLPRYQRAIPTIRSALSMLKNGQKFIPTFSRVFSGQIWDQLHDMGFSVETDMIVSDKSFTPRWTHLRVEHQALGRSTPLFEIGVRTEGLQTILGKIIGPHGSLKNFKKVHDFVSKLFRTRRSLSDTPEISGMLDIVPRVLQEMPNFEISLSMMGYDVIFVKNTDEVRKMIKQSTWTNFNNYLLSIQRSIRLLTNTFTIGSYYELPTTVGTILDFSCMGSFNFKLKELTLNMETGESSQIKMRTSLQPLLTLQAFKRVGSNMHLLNHYHQWDTSMQVGLPKKTEMRVLVDRSVETNPKISIAITIPTVKTQLIKFTNKAYCTISEFYFTGGRLQSKYIADIIQHRSIEKPKTINWQPLINKLLVWFGTQLEINGKYYSNELLYKGPCNMLTGPSEFIVHVQPIEEISTEPIILVGQLQYTLDEGNNFLKKFVYQMNLKKSSDETMVKKLMNLQYRILTGSTTKNLKFETKLRWYVNLPTSYSTEGYYLSTVGEVEMPEDLKIENVDTDGQWLKSYGWVKDRQMKVKLEISDSDGGVGTVVITKSSNQALKNFLQKSSYWRLLQTYPLLKKCVDEAKLSLKSQYNPIFTPSCIEQYKEFNKLSETKVEFIRKVSWFLNRRTSPLLNMGLQTLGRYLQPYLVESTILRVPENNKVVIVSQPSPLDLRVHNLKVTCRYWQMSWKSIQLPATPFYWTGVDPVVTAITDHVKGGSVKCTLHNSHVRTFDNVVYSIPKTTYQQIVGKQCPLLLASDCSKSKDFNVITHVTDSHKFVILHLGKSKGKMVKIEIIKPKDSHQKDSKVKVMGSEIEQTPYSEEMPETQIYSRSIFISGQPVTVSIVKYPYADTSMYKIICHEYQIELLVGGPMLRTVELRVSPFYHNKICGLCGDYNSEKINEFKGPQMQMKTSPQQMVYQYLLPIRDECRMLSQSSPVTIKDYTHSDDVEVSMPTYDLSSRYDEPDWRQSCQVSFKDNYVKTLNNRELPFMSKAIQQLFKRTGCQVKLATVNIGGQQVKIGLTPSKKVVVYIGENQISLPTSHSILNSYSISKNVLGSGLVSSLQKISSGMSQYFRLSVSKGEHKVNIDILSDRIIIRDSDFVKGHGVCQLMHKSHLSYSLYHEIDKVLDLLTDESQCRNTMKRQLMQCDVTDKYLQPFHHSGDLERRQVKFLTQELMELMSTKPKSVLILSVDQPSTTDSYPAYSTQMSFSRKDGKLVRHLYLKKGVVPVVEVRIPQEETSATTIFHNGLEMPVTSCTSEKTLTDGFVCKYDSDRNTVSVYKTDSLNSIIVKLDGEPTFKVERLVPHEHFQNLGACQSTSLVWRDSTHSNPHAVLLMGLQQLTSLPNSVTVGKLVTKEELEATRQLVSKIDRVEYLPEYSEY